MAKKNPSRSPIFEMGEEEGLAYIALALGEGIEMRLGALMKGQWSYKLPGEDHFRGVWPTQASAARRALLFISGSRGAGL